MDFLPPHLRVPAAVASYSVCSGTMLLFNKLAMYYVPVPSFVTVVQLLFAVGIILLLQRLHIVPPDPLESSRVKPYLVYTVAFVLGVYCNMRALSHSNVETVIIFRSCTPLAVSLCDFIFLGRELPSRRSCLALLTIAAGAYGYVQTDSQFKMDGLAAYSWAILYFVTICFEMTYGKKITSGVRFNSMWGPTFYTNFLSVAPMFCLGYLMGDFQDFSLMEGGSGLGGGEAWMWTKMGLVMLAVSSVVGTLIGYTGWSCRSLVSATTFTLVGVINKFITILLNVFIWDKHASPLGISALVLCLVGGSFYQQAPMRAVDKPLGADEFFKLGYQMEMDEYDSKEVLKGAGSIEAVPLIMSTEGGRNGGEKQVPVGAV
ncbi:Hypothetical protein NocV09_00601910 [Nannochloropsis oceanica]